jgi:hypothetical protein
MSSSAGTMAATLARLGEASILLDKRELDAALAGFNEVRTSQLAATDAEVRGRAFEGIGFVQEQKGEFDAALKTFQSMASDVDFRGFKELAKYHQARVLEAKGDKDKAKELLKEVHETLHKPGENNRAFAFLNEAADERLALLDPAFAAESGGKFNIGAGKSSPLARKQQMETMQKLQHSAGGHGMPGMPPGMPPGMIPPGMMP